MSYIGPYRLEEAEGGFKLNIANLPLKQARAYAEEIFAKSNKSLDEVLPDFDSNYEALQKACKKALDMPRIKMPVIEPHDMDEFYKKLKNGNLDIVKPWAKGVLFTPENLNVDLGAASDWVNLGLFDGKNQDDVVKAKWTHIAASKLLPSQSQIWLEKVIGMIDKFGVPKQGGPITDQTIIVSKEGYILDGHHRFGQAMIGDPSLKLKALFIPVDIKTLIKVGRSFGNAQGNQQKG